MPMYPDSLRNGLTHALTSQGTFSWSSFMTDGGFLIPDEVLPTLNNADAIKRKRDTLDKALSTLVEKGAEHTAAAVARNALFADKLRDEADYSRARTAAARTERALDAAKSRAESALTAYYRETWREASAPDVAADALAKAREAHERVSKLAADLRDALEAREVAGRFANLRGPVGAHWSTMPNFGGLGAMTRVLGDLDVIVTRFPIPADESEPRA